MASFRKKSLTPPTDGVRYRSTRGAVQGASFEEVVLGGLAPDRGLYVPEGIPAFSQAELNEMRTLPFSELAFRIMTRYIPVSEIPRDTLRDIIQRSTEAFRSDEVTPVVKTGDMYALELFHGPTFAFKDVALQFLGNLFEYFMSKKPADQRRLTIMGATSGDTGSAAIYGLRGKAHVNCFILYPKGRVSLIQEQQMTTVADSNIHCVRVEGTFDDAQDLVKAAFMDKQFNAEVGLGAVNSINWARVLAQMTYYFYAYFNVTSKNTEKVSFSVPTGNFGDILAGYYAKRMGLPIDKLVVATNENDILHRFFHGGEYHKQPAQASISPSMDICVSSNFERYLFHLFDDDPNKLRPLMEAFESKAAAADKTICKNAVAAASSGIINVTSGVLTRARRDFLSERASSAETLAVIGQYWSQHKYLLCPHTACGYVAAQKLSLPGKMVCLATAHPGKFYDAVGRAVSPLPPLPKELAAVQQLNMRYTDTPTNLTACKELVRNKIGLGPKGQINFALFMMVPLVPLAFIFYRLYF